MTQKEWEKKLLKHLKRLSGQEKEKIAEYYREIYGDKLDAGYSNHAILCEFGDPKECAERILAEEYADADSAHKTHTNRNGRVSVAYIVGICLLSLILILPLTCVAIALVAVFAAVCASACFAAVAGVFSIVWSLLQFSGAATILAGIGVGIITVGVSAILFVVFLLATKYSAIATFKALKFIYLKGEHHE